MPFNLLLISLDTLRADHLSLYGYPVHTTPRLNQWSNRARIYDLVFSVDAWTTPAHAAMFTGLYPVEGGTEGYLQMPPEHLTIAGLLKDYGFLTLANTDGGLMSHSSGLDNGFDLFMTRYEPPEKKFQDAFAWIQLARLRQAPFFVFLHTYGLHEPHSFPAHSTAAAGFLRDAMNSVPVPAGDWISLSNSLQNNTSNNIAIAPYVNALYDASLTNTDEALGNLLDRIDRAGILNNTVVAITGDHGENLLEHDILGHGHQMPSPEICHVPLIVLVPGQHTTTHITQVLSQTDIAHELLEAMNVGLDLPKDSCAQPDLAGAISTTTQQKKYPIEKFVSIVIFGATCEYLTVFERGANTLKVENLSPWNKNSPTCSDDVPRMKEMARCLLQRANTAEAEFQANQPTRKSNHMNQDLNSNLKALGYIQ